MKALAAAVAAVGVLAPAAAAAASPRVFFVNMFSGRDQRYMIGRYVGGNPAGQRVRAGPHSCHLAWPSVTRGAHGTYWLYASENDCRRWARVVVFGSRDGITFRRIGTAIAPAADEQAIRTPYVVHDGRVFRAWVSVDRLGVEGQRVVYAESGDGIHFRRRVGAKLVAGVQTAATTLAVEEVIRRNGRWSLMYTGFNRSGNRAWGGIASFTDPRERSYSHGHKIVRSRSIVAGLTAPSGPGQTTVRVSGAGGFAPGDPIVISSLDGLEAEPARVLGHRNDSLVLSAPLRFPHAAGAPVAVADARKVSPSYVCHGQDGRWHGLFTAFGAFPRATTELALPYVASRLTGPWRLDKRFRFPFFSPFNWDGFYASVENPTQVTRRPDAPACRGGSGPA
ncbi:MAG TPA: hypothetical protein VKB17_04315 [Thermoleophilaceae bacterium]|nr:hypothetical protein [Thermoleophilaceae bacterium]